MNNGGGGAGSRSCWPGMQVLVIVGAVVATVWLWRLLRWLWVAVLARPLAQKEQLRRYGARSGRAWAVVTGASDGIGAGLAQELGVLGFHVVLVGRDAEKLAAAQAAVCTLNEAVEVVWVVSEAADVSVENVRGVLEQAQEAAARHGGELRILVNNVGQGQGGKQRLGDLSLPEDASMDVIDRVLRVNCVYAVQLTRLFLRHVLERPGSAGAVLVINVASCAALVPATPFSALYAASKAFNRAFSLALAGELACKRLLHHDHVRPVDVVAVSPGFVESRLTGMAKSPLCCTAREHARAVLDRITRSRGRAIDLVPHWKHGAMLGLVRGLAACVPHEPLLITRVMPGLLRLSGRFRNFSIKD